MVLTTVLKLSHQASTTTGPQASPENHCILNTIHTNKQQWGNSLVSFVVSLKSEVVSPASFLRVRVGVHRHLAVIL